MVANRFCLNITEYMHYVKHSALGFALLVIKSSLADIKIQFLWASCKVLAGRE